MSKGKKNIATLTLVGLYDWIGRVTHSDTIFGSIFELEYYPTPVKLGEKYGFIDIKGNEIIDLIYEDVGHFSNGLAKVKRDGKYGFIDKKGREVIPIKYDGAEDFYGNDFTTCYLDAKAYLIDKKGEVIV